jgi:hypothetical protein
MGSKSLRLATIPNETLFNPIVLRLTLDIACPPNLRPPLQTLVYSIGSIRLGLMLGSFIVTVIGNGMA